MYSNKLYEDENYTIQLINSFDFSVSLILLRVNTSTALPRNLFSHFGEKLGNVLRFFPQLIKVKAPALCIYVEQRKYCIRTNQLLCNRGRRGFRLFLA